jgi:hypothetical protein
MRKVEKAIAKIRPRYFDVPQFLIELGERFFAERFDDLGLVVEVEVDRAGEYSVRSAILRIETLSTPSWTKRSLAKKTPRITRIALILEHAESPLRRAFLPTLRRLEPVAGRHARVATPQR